LKKICGKKAFSSLKILQRKAARKGENEDIEAMRYDETIKIMGLRDEARLRLLAFNIYEKLRERKGFKTIIICYLVFNFVQ